MRYETTLQDSPVCPHCGHEHRDAFEWDFGPCLDGCIEGRECDSCGESFDCDLVVTVEYTTKKSSAAKAEAKRARKAARVARSQTKDGA